MGQRTRRRRFGIAVAAVAAAVGLVAVALVLGGVLRLGSGLASTPTATPEAPLADPAACPIPADARTRVVVADSTGSGVDLDQGGGAAVLCGRDGQPIVSSGSLECRWSADRSQVRRISITFGDEDNQPLILDLHSEPQMPIALSIFNRGALYRASDPNLVDGAPSGAPSGVLGFRDVPAHVGPGASPNTTTADGYFRWACAEPPPAVDGQSSGTVRLSVDGMVGPARQAWATCSWVEVEGVPVLFALNTASDAMTFDGYEAGVSLVRGRLGEADVPGIFLWISDPARGGMTYSGAFRWPLAATPDMGAATIRYRGFSATEDLLVEDLPNLGGGILSWTCGAPGGEVPPTVDDGEPEVTLARRIGTGSIRLGNPLDEELPATVTCWISTPAPDADPESDPTVPQIELIQLEASYGDERLILTDFDSQLVLERIAPDGRVLGEYVPIDGGAWYSQDADVGPHRESLGRMAFEPSGPPYVPLGGPGGPERFELTITLDCREP